MRDTVTNTRPRRSRWLAGVGVLMCAGVVATSGIGMAQSAERGHPVAVDPRDTSPRHGIGAPGLGLGGASLSERTRATFSIFRRSTRARAAVGAGVTRSVSTTGGTVTVVPAGGWVCLELRDGDAGSGMGCAPEAVAAAGRLVVSVRSDTGARGLVVGLAPDGITQVRPRGLPGRAPVHENVWVLERDRASRVELLDARGEVRGSPVAVPGA